MRKKKTVLYKLPWELHFETFLHKSNLTFLKCFLEVLQTKTPTIPIDLVQFYIIMDFLNNVLEISGNNRVSGFKWLL